MAQEIDISGLFPEPEGFINCRTPVKLKIPQAPKKDFNRILDIIMPKRILLTPEQKRESQRLANKKYKLKQKRGRLVAKLALLSIEEINKLFEDVKNAKDLI